MLGVTGFIEKEFSLHRLGDALKRLLNNSDPEVEGGHDHASLYAPPPGSSGCGLFIPLLKYSSFEAPMPFSIRPYRRFPVQCFVTYNAAPFQGQGTIWNLSSTGWRLSGDLPMQPGETLSLTVTFPNEQRIDVLEAVVQWSRGQDFAVKNLMIEPHTQAGLKHYVKRLVQEPATPSRCCTITTPNAFASIGSTVQRKVNHTASERSRLSQSWS